jgi:hypothetical protein
MIRNNQNRDGTEELCVGCGTTRHSWKGSNRRGYLKGEEKYCCHDCAEGIECTCDLETFVELK